MSEPQPIETAPRDGTVMLTDVGLVKWCSYLSWPLDSPERFWFVCDPSGNRYRDEDREYITEEPTKWTPLPDWMKK